MDAVTAAIIPSRRAAKLFETVFEVISNGDDGPPPQSHFPAKCAVDLATKICGVAVTVPALLVAANRRVSGGSGLRRHSGKDRSRLEMTKRFCTRNRSRLEAKSSRLFYFAFIRRDLRFQYSISTTRTVIRIPITFNVEFDVPRSAVVNLPLRVYGIYLHVRAFCLKYRFITTLLENRCFTPRNYGISKRITQRLRETTGQ